MVISAECMVPLFYDFEGFGVGGRHDINSDSIPVCVEVYEVFTPAAAELLFSTPCVQETAGGERGDSAKETTRRTYRLL